MKLFTQELDNNVWNFSDFQIKTANDIEAKDEFVQFVNCNFKENETPGFVRKQGPFVILWYDKTGHLNGWRTGAKKVLSNSKSDAPNQKIAVGE